MILNVYNENQMLELGTKVGQVLKGGEIIEMIGDLGAGKTTLTKGIAKGLAIEEYVQSPSFTINRLYKGRDELILSHYDFYRLADPGVVADELLENIGDDKVITIIEWADVVDEVLPKDRIVVKITATSETERKVEIDDPTDSHLGIMEDIKNVHFA